MKRAMTPSVGMDRVTAKRALLELHVDAALDLFLIAADGDDEAGLGRKRGVVAAPDHVAAGAEERIGVRPSVSAASNE